NEEPSLHAAEQPLPMPEEIPQVKEPFLLSNRPPSFIQLQKLAGLARNKKEDDIPENPIASNPNLANPSEERHFNQRYFQSINTHPSQMYNGLYKNITNTSSFHFKNESSVQNIAIYANEIDKNPADGLAGEINPSVVPIVGEVEKIVTAAEETNHSAVPIIDEIENIDTTTEEINHPAVPIIDEVESIDTTAEETNHSAVPIIDGIESTDTTAEVINHSAVPIIDGIESIDTTAEEIDDVSLESPIEEMTDQEEPLNEAAPVEHKKEGFSSFFNLFRRRN
ncbi:MAG: hypothetical protein RR588_04625, partial [Solibacillus sp.]